MTSRSLIRTFLFASLAFGASQALAAPVLLVQDRLPCGDSATEDLLNGYFGVEYDVVSAGEIPAQKLLAQYTTIIVSSHQSSAFYTALAEKMPRINKWLQGGSRTLEFHGASGCSEVGYDLRLPRGVQSTMGNWADTNQVLKPRNPLVANVPAELTRPANIGWVSDHIFQPVGRVIMADDMGEATLIDYCVGTGRVIATGFMVEMAWSRNWDSSQLLPNLMTASVLTPGCQNLPEPVPTN